jgi:sugar phosphate permease
MAFLAVTYLCVQYLLALHRSRFVLVLAAGALLDPLLLLLVGTRLTSIALVLAALQATVAAVILLIALRSGPATVGLGAAEVHVADGRQARSDGQA